MPASPPAAFPAPLDAALDAARERVVRLLTDRYADDSLTVEQFEAELDRMHALRSAAALDAMARQLAAPGSPAAQAPAALLVPPGLPNVHGPLPPHLRVVMSNTRRSGAWVVPPHLRVTCVMSDVTLDLREAVFPAFCELEATVVMGNLKLWLPPGARGVVDVGAFMSNVDDRRAGGVGAQGPVVRVTGRVVMGEVQVRRDGW